MSDDEKNHERLCREAVEHLRVVARRLAYLAGPADTAGALEAVAAELRVSAYGAHETAEHYTRLAAGLRELGLPQSGVFN